MADDKEMEHKQRVVATDILSSFFLERSCFDAVSLHRNLCDNNYLNVITYFALCWMICFNKLQKKLLYNSKLNMADSNGNLNLFKANLKSSCP